MLLVDDILLFPAHSILWVFREIGENRTERAGRRGHVDHRATAGPLHAIGDRRISEAEFDAGEASLDRLDAIESRLEDEGKQREPDEDEPDESGATGWVSGETQGNGRPE